MGHHINRSLFAVCTTLLLLAATAGAQVAPDAFGGMGQVTAYYAARWVPKDGTPTPVMDTNSAYIGPGTTDVYSQYWTQIELPNGASFDGIDILVYDNDANGHWSCSVVWTQGAFPSEGEVDPAFDQFTGAMTGDAETPGYTVLSPNFVTSPIIHAWEDIDDDGHASAAAYFLFCSATQVDGPATLRLWGALLHWHRTISPAPASPTFPDVPTNFWAYQYVEALAASGITQGMPDGNFHPKDPVTRAQMATFLARALGLHWAL